MNRRATERLGKEIQWGEDTLFVGLNVDSTWKLTTLDIDYSFALFQKRKWDLGLVAGFYVAAAADAPRSGNSCPERLVRFNRISR